MSKKLKQARLPSSEYRKLSVAERKAHREKWSKRAAPPEEIKAPPNQEPILRPARPQVKKLVDTNNLNAVSAMRTGKLFQAVQKAIVLNPLCPFEGIQAVCQQYITQVCERGFLNTSSTPSSLYWAYVYMYGIVISYITSGTVQAEALPKWIHDLGRALSPKSVKFQGKAEVSYKMALTEIGVVPQSKSTLGPPAYGIDGWNCWVPSPTADVDLFPVAMAPAPIPADGGQDAWANLTQFMCDKNNPQSRMVPIRTISLMDTNVSAFSVGTGQQGGGVIPVAGGIGFTAQLEVPVATPLLGTFCPSTIGAENPIRFPTWASSSSGDPFWTGYVCSNVPTEQWSFKRYARFHCVDFLEFGDVLAIYVTLLQEQFFTSSINLIGFQNGSLNVNNYQCPLSLLEMLLLLRNEILSVFTMQSGVQSLYPITPLSTGDNEFVAYVASATTCSQGAVGMLLPQSFVENLKALKQRSVFSKKNPNDAMWFVPIVGQYFNDVLIQGDYEAGIQTGTESSILPSFGVGGKIPTLKRKIIRKDSKGKDISTWEDSFETPISLIDGTATPNFVFINDQNRLKQLTILWNNWINMFSAYTEPLVHMAGDTGVSILTQAGSTRYWASAAASKKRYENVVDSRIAKKKTLASTVYANRQVFGQTYREQPYTAVVQMFNDVWIQPITFLNPLSSNPSSISTLQRGQIITGEGFLQSESTTGDQGGTLSALHFLFASKMVNQVNAKPSEWTNFFNNAAAGGQGGILSGLVAQWVGGTFGAAAGGVATALADMSPI